MIRSFRDAEAKKLFEDRFSKKYQGIEHIARKRLLALDNAEALEDLAAIPGHHLDALKGGRKGQHSIRINDQFRVCFLWHQTDAFEVGTVDDRPYKYKVEKIIMPGAKNTSEPLPPIHPGAILREEVIEPLGLSVNQFAKALAVDTPRLNEILRGRRGITADTALRLARYLGTTPKFWLNLQTDYELRVARQSKQAEIERAVKPRSEAAAETPWLPVTSKISARTCRPKRAPFSARASNSFEDLP